MTIDGLDFAKYIVAKWKECSLGETILLFVILNLTDYEFFLP